MKGGGGGTKNKIRQTQGREPNAGSTSAGAASARARRARARAGVGRERASRRRAFPLRGAVGLLLRGAGLARLARRLAQPAAPPRTASRSGPPSLEPQTRARPARSAADHLDEGGGGAGLAAAAARRGSLGRARVEANRIHVAHTRAALPRLRVAGGRRPGIEAEQRVHGGHNLLFPLRRRLRFDGAYWQEIAVAMRCENRTMAVKRSGDDLFLHGRENRAAMLRWHADLHIGVDLFLSRREDWAAMLR